MVRRDGFPARAGQPGAVVWGLTVERGSSRGGSALPRTSVAPGSARGGRPGTTILTR